jgi:hypothetical protein
MEATTAMEDVTETSKPQPFTFDLGHLMVIDPNPLPTLPSNNSSTDSKEAILSATAQQCAQGLINQLLTACPIVKGPDGDLQIQLPAPATALPREKPVPKEKEKTKWEKFAEKKGIKAKKKDGKLKYDEASGEWVPRYGYKGKDHGKGQDWLVEVDEKGEATEGAGKKKAQRKKR